MRRRDKTIRVVLYGLLLYVGVTLNVYACRHPALTRSQMLGRLSDVLLWR
jgi:hypothetical protein